MQLTVFANDGDQTYYLEVDASMHLEDLLALISAEVSPVRCKEEVYDASTDTRNHSLERALSRSSYSTMVNSWPIPKRIFRATV